MNISDKISPRLPFVVRVIGVGGLGESAVGRLIESGASCIEFIGAYTGDPAVPPDPAPVRIKLGGRLNPGTGGDPAKGRAAAEKTGAALQKAVSGADLLFIAAGMGGGTGTGAAPVIARKAKSLDDPPLVIGVVTLPLLNGNWEKVRRAAVGIKELRRHVDTLLIIPNEKIYKIINPLGAPDQLAGRVLALAIRDIADPVTTNCPVALDFQDVRVLMGGAGDARIGYGNAAGPGRWLAAAREAAECPLLEDGAIHRAKGALIVVRAHKDIGLPEMDKLLKAVCTIIPREARIKFALITDPALKDELALTIIATGLPPIPDEVSYDDQKTESDQ